MYNWLYLLCMLQSCFQQNSGKNFDPGFDTSLIPELFSHVLGTSEF
jgi:hypothetical protein